MLRRQMLRHEILMLNAYINPNPNLNPNPNPYPALNQKPNYTPQSNFVSGEVSMPEQLSPEHNYVVSPNDAILDDDDDDDDDDSNDNGDGDQ